MPVIQIEKLTKSYGRRLGIDAVDLEVPEGELYGFIGPNGAGKTTTIRVLLGFLKPTAGRARVFGHDAWRDSHRIKRDVGYLPGDVRLYPWLTATRALALLSAVYGRDVRDEGGRLVEHLGLEANVVVRRMSRGMRQKLGLIMALAPMPRLVVLDEPTSGLDPIVQGRLADHLRSLAKRGHTVFFSSHTLSEVEGLCSRVAIVRAGQIVEDEAIETLRARAQRHVVVHFDPDAQTNDLVPPPGLKILKRDGSRWRGVLDGPVAPLIAWLATQPVRDLEISPPDLERLFHAFYGDTAL